MAKYLVIGEELSPECDLMVIEADHHHTAVQRAIKRSFGPETKLQPTEITAETGEWTAWGSFVNNAGKTQQFFERGEVYRIADTLVA